MTTGTPFYVYHAVITRWVDGDTVHMTVDVGFGMDAHMDFRLYGIDTPERGQAGYAEASARAAELAPVGTTVLIHTYKAADKYGRYLVIIDTETGTVNQTLVDEHHAVPYFGGTKAVAP